LARAKPTNRAEARRRHRLATAQVALDESDGTPSDVAGAANGGASTPRQRAATPAQPERPGITAAFRNAYRPLHLREDLVALPTLVRGRWFLIAIALVAVGWIAPSIYYSNVTLLIQSILALPLGGPTLPIFLVGFTALRASYLLGLLLGLIDIALALVFAPLQISATVVPQDVLVQGVIYGLPTAVLFSAGAAWYRRFLAASSGRRQQQQRASARGKGGARPANRR
jgi:hypothetical protein